jgi:hypothetical protein
VLGFYLRMEDMSSPGSETEWADLFTGPLRIEDHVWFEDRWMVASLCDE